MSRRVSVTSKYSRLISKHQVVPGSSIVVSQLKYFALLIDTQIDETMARRMNETLKESRPLCVISRFYHIVIVSLCE